MSRHSDRVHVFRLIFQTEFQGEQDMLSLLGEYFDDNLKEGDNREYIEAEYRGVLGKMTEVDKVISENAINWSIERLDKVDLAILRLAVYEILFTDVPGQVAANEAVIIAKEFSAEKAPKFINGILGRVLEERL